MMKEKLPVRGTNPDAEVSPFVIFHTLGSFSREDLHEKVEKMENQGRIQVITAKKTGPEEMDEVYRFWCTCQVSHTDLVQDSQYTGWYADMELQNFGKELLGGFILHDTFGNALLTYSLWTHRELPDLLLLYQAMSDEHILSVFGNSSKDDILRQLEDMKKEYVAQGTIAKSLAFENGVLLCR